MSTTNLSAYDIHNIPDAQTMRIGIVVSEWNEEITGNLLKGAVDTLVQHGATMENIHIIHVPGAFELPTGAQMIIQNKRVEAAIVLGCVIRGETPHFEFVCSGCAHGVQDVARSTNTPVIFGLLTDNTLEQSLARSGGALGNKGVEAAVTAIKMIAVKRQLEADRV